MNIPMVDLKGQYETLREEIEKGFRETLESTRFILGPNGQALEREIADYCGVKHALGLSSGTDALHLALRAAGIGAGDEVITTSFTFIATAEAIAYVGARPVFVDIDPRTMNLDPALVEAAVTERTRAVLPVHLFGRPADLDPILEVCNRFGLKLIEDCAQAFGAEYRGKKVGTIGDFGCFSFFPSKNLGCYGDGGMVVTNDDDLAEQVRILRNHGSREQYHHSVIGYNSRLDDLQAVVLRVKLRRIDQYNDARRRNAELYLRNLEAADILLPDENAWARHVYHQYTIRTTARDSLKEALSREGIASAVYYPIPLHRQEVFREFRSFHLPETEKAAESVLSLPMYPEMTGEQVGRVCSVLLNALGNAG